MFTSQATIERRAAKEARLHSIEERLDDLTTAVAAIKSQADMQTMADRMDALGKRLDALCAVDASRTDALDALSKRLDALSATNTEALDALSQRLDALSATNTEALDTLSKRLDAFRDTEYTMEQRNAVAAANLAFDQSVRERFDTMKADIAALKSELADTRTSLEKKIGAAKQPLFPAKNSATTATKSFTSSS